MLLSAFLTDYMGFASLVIWLYFQIGITIPLSILLGTWRLVIGSCSRIAFSEKPWAICRRRRPCCSLLSLTTCDGRRTN
jgi:hypothetical protein